MSILVVGGDSAETFRQRAAGRQGQVLHWSGRKARDTGKAIPKDTEAVVVVLDRISHALARKVRTEAAKRGLPVFFQKRGRQMSDTEHHPTELTQLFTIPKQ
jgi:hypothetical protein